MNFEKILSGEERPPQIPANWIGRPTVSAKGWRWDDPNDAGNSVRIFAGDPSDKTLSNRQPFVVVLSDGKVIGPDGKPTQDDVAAPE